MTLTLTKGSTSKSLELDSMNEMVLDNRFVGTKVYDVTKGETVPSLEGFDAVKNFDSLSLYDDTVEISLACDYTTIVNLVSTYDSTNHIYNVMITLN